MKNEKHRCNYFIGKIGQLAQACHNMNDGGHAEKPSIRFSLMVAQFSNSVKEIQIVTPGKFT